MRRSAVLTLPARVFLPLSGLALFMSMAYGRLTGDLFGISVLLGLVIVAGFSAVIVAGFRVNEVAPIVTADSDAAGYHEVDQVAAPGGGAWPFLAAVSVTLCALGLVFGATSLYFGLGAGAVTVVGWLARVSGDRTGRGVNLLPVGLPVLTLFTVASVMFFMSRVLLAVPEAASTLIALVVALVIMGAGILFAVKPSISSRTLTSALAVGAVVMVGGGIVAAAAGEREIELHGEHGEGATLVALDTTFDKHDLTLAAGGEGSIAFDNKDVGVPHNVSVYEGSDAKGKNVFKGEIITGPATKTYLFEVPPVGSYYFQCDVHPATMTGTLKVSEADVAGEGEKHGGPEGTENQGPSEREGGVDGMDTAPPEPVIGEAVSGDHP